MKKLLLGLLAASTLAGAATAQGILTVANYGSYIIMMEDDRYIGKVGDPTPSQVAYLYNNMVRQVTSDQAANVRTWTWGLNQDPKTFRVPSEGECFVHFGGTIVYPTVRQGCY